MHTSSSAKRTCSDSWSGSLYTATVATPSSRHARITRSAISPRLAIRIFLNIDYPIRPPESLNRSLNVRSDVESIPLTFNANSLGLDE